MYFSMMEWQENILIRGSQNLIEKISNFPK